MRTTQRRLKGRTYPYLDTTMPCLSFMSSLLRWHSSSICARFINKSSACSFFFLNFLPVFFMEPAFGALPLLNPPRIGTVNFHVSLLHAKNPVHVVNTIHNWDCHAVSVSRQSETTVYPTVLKPFLHRLSQFLRVTVGSDFILDYLITAEVSKMPARVGYPWPRAISHITKTLHALYKTVPLDYSALP